MNNDASTLYVWYVAFWSSDIDGSIVLHQYMLQPIDILQLLAIVHGTHLWCLYI